ncbi:MULTISPECIES: DUF6941 family protein [Pseudomonas]|uniref:DUF6941 family protein n=1 Tax=Pseudomonas TaxID=286 RepID=UPI0006946089|nr:MULTISPECIES: hypothetical protein [Pseudomonas]KAB0532785.1 hypothetical protein F7R16_11110 [Pseudomonas chlororaphis subsp. aureofaciens]TSD26027.1 hypothetical protein FCE86_031680 [Pseudomonas sp. ATCC 13985]WDG57853.1 hypothetical protein PUP52_18575 [Pseudomonas chlororaphis]WDG64066.1 hypothetical protein PUP59_18580 [Pseudomonas chlororaphis]SDS73035.1 hypothetical protein SAMN04489803_2094 [Pseudomonas chlororaphis]
MNRYTYSIFCDDIRNEVNGKTSLIGVVGGLLYVNTFPCVIPKLCVLITAVTDHDNPFKSLTFKVLVGEDPAFDVTLGEDEIQKISQGQELIEDPKGFAAQAVVVMSPLSLQGPSTIKVFVVADGEKLDCASLQISLAPEGAILG